MAGLAATATTAAKEFGAVGAAQGIVTVQNGASYRYVTVNQRTRPALTIVERIDMSDGAIDRWWYLRGNYVIPAVAYDGSAGGLSADGKTLTLVNFSRAFPPPETKVAVLNTGVYLRHPRRPGQHRPQHAIRYPNLQGQLYFQAISPNGAQLYLRHYRTHDRGSSRAGPMPSTTATCACPSCSRSTPRRGASSGWTCRDWSGCATPTR